jgi:hypothetical protein
VPAAEEEGIGAAQHGSRGKQAWPRCGVELQPPGGTTRRRSAGPRDRWELQAARRRWRDSDRRDGGLAKVTLFCNKYGIQVPFPSDTYVPHGRSLRFYDTQTNDDHFRRQVYLGVVDQVIQELDNRFDEINMELLVCMSCLNPTNSFASYDASKLMRLAEFYPKDISSMDLVRLEFQLGTFIDDMRRDDRCNNSEFVIQLLLNKVPNFGLR